MQDLLIFSHFYKEFPFNYECEWIKPTSDRVRFARPGVIDITASKPSIFDFQPHFDGVSDEDFLTAFGSTATEYWLLHHTPDVPYIGTTSYRRYLQFDGALTQVAALVKLPATEASAGALSSNAQRDAALLFLKSADAIVSRSVALGQSIQAQHVQKQLRLYWDLFLEGIALHFPQYRRHLLWLTDYNVINLFSLYVMRRELFVQYASELFVVLKHVLSHAKPVFPGKIEGERMQPFRYPAFLQERFMPFFLYANAVRKIEVPVVVLSDGTAP